MRELRIRINFILLSCIFVLVMVILFVDDSVLNSLFIRYDDSFVVQEVGILDVDYEKLIYSSDVVTTTNPVPVSNLVTSSRGWVWPTSSNYLITTYYSASHKALDIYSYQGYGSDIYVANDGVVTSVQGGCVAGNLACNGRGGNYIVVRHNQGNYYTVYMHLKDIRVSVGQNVLRGQVIGSMGNTGNVIPVPTSSSPYSGTHLHFCLYVGEPYRGGYEINPMTLY